MEQTLSEADNGIECLNNVDAASGLCNSTSQQLTLVDCLPSTNFDRENLHLGTPHPRATKNKTEPRTFLDPKMMSNEDKNPEDDGSDRSNASRSMDVVAYQTTWP